MTNKKGFSLAEILIMLVVLGIIAAIIISNNKNNTYGYNQLYSFVFNNIQKITGQLLSESASSKLDENDSEFCTKIVEMVNISGNEINCHALTPAEIIANPLAQDDFYISVKETPFLGLTDTVIDKPNFSLSNGQRFYLSRRIPDLPFGYRIMSVDINGTARPNEINRDIVAFLVYDNGEVLPLGKAADDKIYLSVTVSKYNKSTGINTGEYVLSESGNKFLTFREAFCKAGLTSSFLNYCKIVGGFDKDYYVDNACLSTSPTTFCQLRYIKTNFKVRI